MEIKINGIYRHYKGNYYKVLAIGKHSESLDNLVIYQAQYGSNDIWCRPLDMWNDEIDYNGKTCKRFELVKE